MNTTESWIMLVTGLALTVVGIRVVVRSFRELGNIQHPTLAGVVFLFWALLGLFTFLIGVIMIQGTLTTLGPIMVHWLVQLNGG